MIRRQLSIAKFLDPRWRVVFAKDSGVDLEQLCELDGETVQILVIIVGQIEDPSHVYAVSADTTSR